MKDGGFPPNVASNRLRVVFSARWYGRLKLCSTWTCRSVQFHQLLLQLLNECSIVGRSWRHSLLLSVIPAVVLNTWSFHWAMGREKRWKKSPSQLFYRQSHRSTGLRFCSEGFQGTTPVSCKARNRLSLSALFSRFFYSSCHWRILCWERGHVRRSSRTGPVMTRLHCKTRCDKYFIPELLHLTQMLLNAFLE